jgi:hypothetical protein
MTSGGPSRRNWTGRTILVGAIGAGIASIFTTISAVDSLTNSIAVEQTAILDKVNSLGATWPKTNTDSMSHSSDWKRQP